MGTDHRVVAPSSKNPRASNSGCDEMLRKSVTVPGGHAVVDRVARPRRPSSCSAAHAASPASSSVGRGGAPGVRVERRVLRPGRIAEGGAQPGPLLIGLRPRRPATAPRRGTGRPPGARGPVVRLPSRRQQVAVGGVLDDLLGGDVEGALDERRLDEQALPVASPCRPAPPGWRTRRAWPRSGRTVPAGSIGGPSGKPVTHARPDMASMVWAKPTRSRHGPSSP